MAMISLGRPAVLMQRVMILRSTLLLQLKLLRCRQNLSGGADIFPAHMRLLVDNRCRFERATAFVRHRDHRLIRDNRNL